MKSRLRVGILGCANIAARYAIDAFKLAQGAELVAIASRDKTKAEEWGKRYSLEPESYQSLLERNDIDVIYSPLPIGLQEEWVLKAAENKKHVICEKSLTYSYDSAQRMVHACQENGVFLYENFVPNFHTQHAKVLSLIENGIIGTPRVWNGSFGFPPFSESDIRNSKELKGGSLNDAGCYTLFMARKIAAEEPIAVTCSLDMGQDDIDIAGVALVEFPKMNALLSFGFDNLYQNTYSVWGSKGLIRIPRAFAIPPTMAPHIEVVTNDGKQDFTETISVPSENQFQKSFEFFCDAILSDDKSTQSDLYKRILSQAKAMEAMRLSAQNGVRVKLDTL